MMDNVWIVGSREEVTEKLAALNAEVGGFGMLLAMGHEWLPHDAWMDSMGMLVNEILPAI